MNNFTKTESLPKSGHVTEVCKEWLVREDSAFAYKLQSQEINDFYKGNRYRNAVVREDFPTAMQEQNMEIENAEKLAELQRRRQLQQEEHDKRVAREITEKLERDLQEQQQRDMLESEFLAQKMQQIYVNLPPVPPPAARDKSRPPPRPAKASTLQQQNATELSASNARNHAHHHQQQQQPKQQSHQPPPHNKQQQQQQQLHHHHPSSFVDIDCYVGLTRTSAATNHSLLVSDDPPATTQPSSSSSSSTSSAHNQFGETRAKLGRGIGPPLTADNFVGHAQQRPPVSSPVAGLTSPTAGAVGAASSSSSSASPRRNVFEFIQSTTPQTSTNAHTTPTTPTHTKVPNTNTSTTTTPTACTPLISSTAHQSHSPPSSSSSSSLVRPLPLHPTVDEHVEYSDVADSIRRYDITDSPGTTQHNITSPSVATPSSASNFNRLMSPSHENLLRAEPKFQKLSPEKYDQLVGNGAGAVSGAAAERHMQQHADDIEMYVDPCDYASLKEIGLPMDEIKEMSKKLKQEQKDALLARRLQAMESHDGLTQEERDRLMAIEAQDKELAKMLQEREKAKAKRSKEKARLRKSQKDTANSSSLCSMSHCGPLLPLPQDCMSSSSSKHHSTGASSSTAGHAQHSPPAAAALRSEDLLEDLEAYSNPIDVLHGQRLPNGTLTNGSLTREPNNSTGRHASHGSHVREDDIYTLPVDSCRPGQRPASMSVGVDNGPTVQHNSMTRSENYSSESHDSVNGFDVSPRMNYSKSGTFDHGSSPTPPYMPIQGTRRSNSSEDRKKKSKDKCTHQ